MIRELIRPIKKHKFLDYEIPHPKYTFLFSGLEPG